VVNIFISIKKEMIDSEIFEKYNLHKIPTNIGILYGNIENIAPSINGLCSPLQLQKSLVDSFSWNNGLVFMENVKKSQIILVQNFFILSSMELPINNLELRDLYDYFIEKKLIDKYNNISVQIGPQWNYIYTSKNVIKNLNSNILKLSNPIIGNSLNVRGNDFEYLMKLYPEIKNDFIGLSLVPTVFGMPNDLTWGIKDNIFDIKSNTWYSVEVVDKKFNGAVSLIDLNNKKEIISMYQHNFETKEITKIQASIENIVIEIQTNDKSYSTTKNLKDIIIIYE
jgi:hypothetical protein